MKTPAGYAAALATLNRRQQERNRYTQITHRDVMRELRRQERAQENTEDAETFADIARSLVRQGALHSARTEEIAVQTFAALIGTTRQAAEAIWTAVAPREGIATQY